MSEPEHSPEHSEEPRPEAERQAHPDLFRGEAVSAFVAAERAVGPALRLSPAWLDYLYYLLLALFVTAVGVLAFGRVARYVSGPAVVTAEPLAHVLSSGEGTVVAVKVVAGEWVQPGQALLELDSAEQLATLAALNAEREAQTAAARRNPGDPRAEQEMAALTLKRDEAQRRLEARTLRAPCAGRVGAVRTHRGGRVQPGELVVSVAPEPTRHRVLAFLPADQRSALAVGLPLRLELATLPGRQTLEIDQVGPSTLGASELQSLLGREAAQALALSGPVMVVAAEFPSARTAPERAAFPLYEGMQGRVEVAVRKEPLGLLLFPWLRELGP